MANPLDCNEKYQKVLDFVSFVGDISGVGFRSFGSGYLAVGPNCKSEFFDSSFYWKLGYNLSILSF